MSKIFGHFVLCCLLIGTCSSASEQQQQQSADRDGHASLEQLLAQESPSDSARSSADSLNYQADDDDDNGDYDDVDDLRTSAIEAEENNPFKATMLESLLFGIYYGRLYRKINDHLVGKVDGDDVEANMLEANNWLRDLKVDQSIINKSLVKAMSQFVSLQDLDFEGQTGADGKDLCSDENYKILSVNAEAVRGKSKESRKGYEARRLERIFYRLANKHASFCLAKHLQLWQQALASGGDQDLEALRQVEVLAAHMNDDQQTYYIHHFDRKSGNMETSYVSQIFNANTKFTSIPGGARSAIAALKRLSENDTKSKFRDLLMSGEDKSRKAVEAKLKDLHQKYLVAPCKQTVEKLGSHILGPTSLDLKFLSLEDFKSVRKNNPQFYVAWKSFRVCEMMLKGDQKQLVKLMALEVAKAQV